MIKYFNRYGEELRYKEFIELQWSRKYNECGDFVLYMAATDYDPEIKYIKNVGCPETGIVQKVQMEKKPEGDFVTLSGFFIEKLAEWGQQWCDFGWALGSGTLTHEQTRKVFLAIMYGNFSQFRSKESGIVSGEDPSPLNNNMYCTTINSQSVFPKFSGALVKTETTAGQAFYDFCNADNASYYCNPIFNSKNNEATQPLVGLEFVFYKGRDLKEDIYFGTAWNNVKKIDYTLDESSNKTHYTAVQQVEYATGFTGVESIPTMDGVKHYIAEKVVNESNMPGDLGKVYPVKVLHTNISGVEMVSANEAKIRGMMRQEATLDMLNNYKIENISADVIQNRFLYRQDYDLGDVCSIVIDEIQQMYTARIVEIYEVHSANKVDVQIVLGTPQKQKYRRII